MDSAERGFSFLREGPLDMRMGPSAGITAAQIVNTWPQEELGHLIRLYGEDKMWKRYESHALPIYICYFLLCIMPSGLSFFLSTPFLPSLPPSSLVFY